MKELRGIGIEQQRDRSRTPIVPPFIRQGVDQMTEDPNYQNMGFKGKLEYKKKEKQFVNARTYLHDLLHSDHLNLRI